MEFFCLNVKLIVLLEWNYTSKAIRSNLAKSEKREDADHVINVPFCAFDKIGIRATECRCWGVAQIWRFQ
jgi:hypothetical protein